MTKEVSLDSEEAKEELAKRTPTDCGDAAAGSRAVDEKTPKAALEKLPSTLTTPSGGVSSVSSPSAGAAPATTKLGTPTLKAASLSGPSGSAAVEKILGSLGKQKAPSPSGRPLSFYMICGFFLAKSGSVALFITKNLLKMIQLQPIAYENDVAMAYSP